MECAKLMSENASKYSVKILKGGYEAFSKYYPFLRTQQIIYMPRVNSLYCEYLSGFELILDFFL